MTRASPHAEPPGQSVLSGLLYRPVQGVLGVVTRVDHAVVHGAVATQGVAAPEAHVVGAQLVAERPGLRAEGVPELAVASEKKKIIERLFNFFINNLSK